MSQPASQRRRPTERRLADFLGWFSFSLGVPQLTVPGLVNRLIGVRNDRESRFWQRVVGVREIAAWAGILSRPRPVAWLWSRVAGDIKDLTLLGAAYRNRCENPRRLAAATASVVGVTALDVYTAVRMTRSDRSTTEHESATRVKAAITVKKPLAEVFGAWERIENLPVFMEHLESVETTGDRRSHWKAKGPAGRTIEWDAETIAAIPNELIQWSSVDGSPIRNSGAVRFTPASGGRGTEVHLRMEYEPPAGKLGETVAKLLGEDPVQQVKDDLRRFKQVMEVGEIIRSESTPEGAGGRRYMRQRPAQPVEEAELAAAGGSRS